MSSADHYMTGRTAGAGAPAPSGRPALLGGR